MRIQIIFLSVNVKKLVPNLFDKEKYVLHYENLQLYLKLGLKLKKMHRVLEINQSQWLKPYIAFKTQKSIEAEKRLKNDQDKNRKERKDKDKDRKVLY